ncbi:MAG: hypothetical protein COZ49_01295 [Candidatus Yonathbacteria bacterium CG_4_10_14_3_um_filter_47_65]|uniref:T4 beta protein n=2 Tax=Parcubacteria group TaxID=1794811 RepID=A0A2M8D9K2_9BACT|nr:MAG: hypothetical protein COW61_00100 [Candidatus Yonathbacteria bacterium CG17_big_fil_post_rev_8_21_14_2_50_46_19]PIX56599.1 MAG: hypothetical protein COZ49_01295 [Candidatus Yonathbacteria bacterium CG_4_10_14_3_um_filter_47_65]PIY57403.1 MAG: hypothetical protein COY99_03190 [Candidatus Yonathbacteria bacterium CG_4_10_14_0_8_um_filter_47_645]PJB83813.1 MAG: hypothetical protein CO088_00875 [Candidatus Yonathbacteria bacterium CG_4_9_14_0_8_um_filter_46_47]PJC20221.1 MAG: hypothetical pr
MKMTPIKPYVPILRWRPAEMLAFERLSPEGRELLTPFIEFIMPPPKTDKDDRRKIVEDEKSKFLRQLPDVGKRLLKYCGRSTVFLDVHLLDGDIRASSFENILSAATEVDLFSIPVVHIIPVVGTDADMATRKVAVKYAKIDGRGMCIRIDNSHFKDENLTTHIDAFVNDSGLDIKNVDIVVDLQTVAETVTAASVVEKISRLPQIKVCRSFILTGGSFPRDLSELEVFNVHALPRTDWKLWQGVFQSDKLTRKPLFSDYTIQHPIFYGYIPGASVSASIRYTDEEQWQVFRGRALNYLDKKNGGKRISGYDQYIAHAKELVKQPYYKQAGYSYGDSEINRIASQDEKTGNPQMWLNIGINHHLTLVARQLADFHEKIKQS